MRGNWTLGLLLAGLLTSPALASLSRPPASYVKPVGDGQHFLVMLAPTPPAEDTGNLCTLPDGRTLLLQGTFRASGLYRYGAVVPEWTIGVYGEGNLTQLSADGRYLVMVNRFGGDDGVHLQWGVRFFDRGVLIRSYGVGDLVDYPSLMTYTSIDWHYLWIDESVYDSAIHNGQYRLTTSTRDKYTFDVATGDIVAETRYWRSVGFNSLLAIGLAAVLLAVTPVRRSFRKPAARELDRPSQPEQVVSVPSLPFRFSLRSLLLAWTLCAVLIAWAAWAPHIFALCLPAATAAVCMFRLRKLNRNSVVRRRKRAALWTTLIAASLATYLLSFVPILELTQKFHWRDDSRMVLAQTFYAPVYWLICDPMIADSPTLYLYWKAWDESLRF